MLEKMSYDLIFNGKVDKNKVFVSPGGYEIKVKGKNIQFDFEHYEGNVDEFNPMIVHVTHTILDVDSFPDAEKISVTDIMKNAVFTEFYVNIENDDGKGPEIIPTAVRNLSFEFSAGIRVYANPELLGSANVALGENEF